MRRSNCVTVWAFSPADFCFENKSTPQADRPAEEFEP
jgi:hypothetical protein